MRQGNEWGGRVMEGKFGGRFIRVGLGVVWVWCVGVWVWCVGVCVWGWVWCGCVWVWAWVWVWCVGVWVWCVWVWCGCIYMSLYCMLDGVRQGRRDI